RRGRFVPKPREKKNVVLTSDLHQLAENARIVWGETGDVFMLTKAYTGMRLGEMFGLRREFCHPYWPASDPDAERRGESV
ncbi:integrase, partial [Streptomyces sp. A73]|nr:integrase [Streptomyces sp. A73]